MRLASRPLPIAGLWAWSNIVQFAYILVSQRFLTGFLVDNTNELRIGSDLLQFAADVFHDFAK